MTNLHAHTVALRPQTHLNRPFRFNPAPKTQATGNQIFPARTWTFSTQPFATAVRTAISPVMHPAVPVMPIPSSADYASATAPIMAQTRAAAKPSLAKRILNWL